MRTNTLFHGPALLRILAAALVAAVCPLSVGAQTQGHWSSNGPYGGQMGRVIACTRPEGEVLYAVASGLVLKGTEGGALWTSTGLTYAYALGADSRGQRIYAAANYNLYVSADGGASWEPTGLQNKQVQSLAVDPSNPLRLFVSTTYFSYEFLKSEDGGLTWRDASGGQSFGGFGAITFDPKSPSTIWMTNQGGLWRSTDGGDIWRLVSAGATFSTIILHPRKAKLMYACGSSGVLFKSKDYGTTWKQFGPSDRPGDCNILALDPVTPSVLYTAITGQGVFRSTDNGLSWYQWTIPDAYFFDQILLSPSDHRRIYVASEEKLYVSPKNCKTWSVTSLGALYIDALAVDPTGGPIVLAACRNGLFKSADRGATWRYLSLWPGGAGALAISPSSPSIIYASVPSTICARSTDGGATWVAANAGLPAGDTIQTFAIAPGTPERLYAGLDDGVYRSDNGGASWTRLPVDAISVSSPSRISALAIDLHNPRVILASLQGTGIIRSIDGGDSWALTYLRSVFNIPLLVADPTRPGVFFTGGDGGYGGAYKSSDGGLTWRGISLPVPFINSMAVDPVRSGRLYVGTCTGCSGSTSGIQVQVSSDDGATWEVLGEGLTEAEARALVVTPDGSALYAGLGNGAFAGSTGWVFSIPSPP